MARISISLLLILIVCCWLACFSLQQTISTRHEADGDVTITINLNVNSRGRSVRPIHVKKQTKPEESKPKIDSLSKQAAAIIENSVSSKDATRISEDLLVLANEIRNIANLIPSNEGKEKKDLKDQLTVIVANLFQQAETPKALLLESSLALVAQRKFEQEHASSGGSSLLEHRRNTQGAETLLIPTSPLDWVALGMDVVDGIGTYSTKFNKLGEFMSGPVASKLEKWNMKSLASVSKSTGGTISTYSKKLEPYEQKAAKFIAPVVKSKSFQVVKKSVGVVSGVLSIHGGLQSLHLIKGGGVKLPTNFAALKSSLSTAVTKSNKLIANAKTFVTSSGKMTKLVGASKTIATTAKRVAKMNAIKVTRMSNWDKIKHVDGLKGAYDSVKDFKSDYTNLKTYVSNKMNSKNKSQSISKNIKQNNNRGRSNSNIRNNKLAASTQTNANKRGRSSMNSNQNTRKQVARKPIPSSRNQVSRKPQKVKRKPGL